MRPPCSSSKSRRSMPLYATRARRAVGMPRSPETSSVLCLKSSNARLAATWGPEWKMERKLNMSVEWIKTTVFVCTVGETSAPQLSDSLIIVSCKHCMLYQKCFENCTLLSYMIHCTMMGLGHVWILRSGLYTSTRNENGSENVGQSVGRKNRREQHYGGEVGVRC